MCTGLQVLHECLGKCDKVGNPAWNCCIPPLTPAEVLPQAGAAGRNLLPLGFNKGRSRAPSTAKAQSHTWATDRLPWK